MSLPAFTSVLLEQPIELLFRTPQGKLVEGVLSGDRERPVTATSVFSEPVELDDGHAVCRHSSPPALTVAGPARVSVGTVTHPTLPRGELLLRYRSPDGWALLTLRQAVLQYLEVSPACLTLVASGWMHFERLPQVDLAA